jgi:DNA-binding transcriptional regulator YiaG
MTIELRRINGREPDGDPFHYTACGLNDVYLVNGFTRETVDGEEFITIEDMDGLWKAIGLTLVTERKVLAPKEIRFLREHMDLTQAELGNKLRVADQTVARWEKGETDMPGSADLLLRVLFLACPCAQPEGERMLEKLAQFLERIIEQDEPRQRAVVFRHGKRKWTEERQLEVA